MDQNENLSFEMEDRPILCELCGGIMIFSGLGTYRCEKCNHMMLDDYGRVRAFLEVNPGASIVQTSASTGVKQHKIRQMLKESRFQITQGSSSFLRCEMCGVSIVCGRFCPKCEMQYHRQLEEEQRAQRKQAKMQGIGKNDAASENGAKRFERS